MLLLQDFLIFYVVFIIFYVIAVQFSLLLNAQVGLICFNIKGVEEVCFPNVKSIIEFRLLQLSGFYA